MTEGGLLLQEEKEFKRFYKLSLWWVEHRAFLRRLGFALFIAMDAGLLLYGGWHLLDAFAISYDAERNAVLRMVALGQADLRAYTAGNAADDLETQDARAISIGNSRYDLYTTLTNPNADWWAEFTYAFALSDGQTDSRHGFILPMSEKPVAELAVEASVPISRSQLVLEDVRWHRVDRHAVADYASWADDRLNLEILDARFSQEARADGQAYGRTTFVVKNDTAYSYYDVGLFVLLKRGSAVVGVNRTTLSTIASGEEASLAVNWFGTLPSVSEVEVIPELNIFDVAVYKPLAGETTRDTRTRVFDRR